MIIGNNRNDNNLTNKPFQKLATNFDEKFSIKEKENSKHPIITGKKSTDFYDVLNKKDMTDKSYAILQERYNNGLITLDEFRKKCQQLNKLRKK